MKKFFYFLCCLGMTLVMAQTGFAGDKVVQSDIDSVNKRLKNLKIKMEGKRGAYEEWNATYALSVVDGDLVVEYSEETSFFKKGASKAREKYLEKGTHTMAIERLAADTIVAFDEGVEFYCTDKEKCVTTEYSLVHHIDSKEVRNRTGKKKKVKLVSLTLPDTNTIDAVKNLLDDLITDGFAN